MIPACDIANTFYPTSDRNSNAWLEATLNVDYPQFLDADVSNPGYDFNLTTKPSLYDDFSKLPPTYAAGYQPDRHSVHDVPSYSDFVTQSVNDQSLIKPFSASWADASSTTQDQVHYSLPQVEPQHLTLPSNVQSQKSSSNVTAVEEELVGLGLYDDKPISSDDSRCESLLFGSSTPDQSYKGMKLEEGWHPSLAEEPPALADDVEAFEGELSLDNYHYPFYDEQHYHSMSTTPYATPLDIHNYDTKPVFLHSEQYDDSPLYNTQISGYPHGYVGRPFEYVTDDTYMPAQQMHLY